MGGSQSKVSLDEVHREGPFNPSKVFSKFSLANDTISISDL